MYKIIRPLLFKLSPEAAHDLVLMLLSICSKTGIYKLIALCYRSKLKKLPVKIMGLEFDHPIGLAAGLDKDARAFNAFSALGFSAVEMGTVTPKSQAGNPKPRMFRLERDRAIINRMGFNSGGLAKFVYNIGRRNQSAIAGINIGKNKLTPNEYAIDDYLQGLRTAYLYADYITVNISSPNTEALRELQSEEPLTQLLEAINQERTVLSKEFGQYKPIALKIAPDLNSKQIKTIAELVIKYKFDALIATNTTVTRITSLKGGHQNEAGGLSGAPLKDMSTNVIAEFYSHLKGQVPIIGVGGIETAEDAWEKLVAGADFLQIYSGFIYHGPNMIRKIINGLSQKASKHNSLAEAIAAHRK